MVQVLVGDMRLSAFVLFRVLFQGLVLDELVILFLFDDLQLPCFFVEDELLAGKDYPFVGLHRLRI